MIEIVVEMPWFIANGKSREPQTFDKKPPSMSQTTLVHYESPAQSQGCPHSLLDPKISATA
jgi:hypothetical protein